MDGGMEPTKKGPSCGSGNSVEHDGGLRSATPPAPAPPSSDEAAACSLCGKSFPTRKAMYGHMRCHSERKRKAGGGAPPTAAPALPEMLCAGQVDCISSLASPLPSWSMTKKRGSKGVAAAAATAAAAVDRDPGGAVENGAPGGAPEGAETKKAAASEEEPDSEVSTTNAGHGFGAEPCSCDCCRKLRCSPPSSSQKKRMPAAEEAAAGSGKSYACDSCGKTFTSFQALGGHMANHGRHAAEKCSDVVVVGGGGVGSAAAAGCTSKPKQRRRLEPSNEEHRCNVCGKTYPTGQALGGHKRLHWEGIKRRPPPNSGGATAAPPSPTQLQKTSSTTRVHDFDLNELPEKQEEDDGPTDGCRLL